MGNNTQKPPQTVKHPPFVINQDFRGGRDILTAYQGLASGVALLALQDYIDYDDTIKAETEKIAELKRQLKDMRQDPDMEVGKIDRLRARISFHEEAKSKHEDQIARIKDFFEKRWRLFVGESDPYVFISLMREVSKTTTDGEGKEVFLRQIIGDAKPKEARRLMQEALENARKERNEKRSKK